MGVGGEPTFPLGQALPGTPGLRWAPTERDGLFSDPLTLIPEASASNEVETCVLELLFSFLADTQII